MKQLVTTEWLETNIDQVKILDATWCLPNSNRNLSRRTQRKPIISADTNGHNYGNTFSDKGWISQILITEGAIKKIPLNDSNILYYFVYNLSYPMGFQLLPR